jgi:hypothetical protein
LTRRFGGGGGGGAAAAAAAGAWELALTVAAADAAVCLLLFLNSDANEKGQEEAGERKEGETKKRKKRKKEVGVEKTTTAGRPAGRRALFVPRAVSGVFFSLLSLSDAALPPSSLIRSGISTFVSTRRRFLDARHRTARRRAQTSKERGPACVPKDGLACESGDERMGGDGKTRERGEEACNRSLSLFLHRFSLALLLVARSLPSTFFSPSSSMPQRDTMSARIREERREAE